MRKSVLKRKRVGRFGNELQNVAKEIAVWKKLSHPNVLQCIEVIDDPEFDKIYLISELANGGACMPNEVTCTPLKHEQAKRWSSMMVRVDKSGPNFSWHVVSRMAFMLPFVATRCKGWNICTSIMLSTGM